MAAGDPTFGGRHESLKERQIQTQKQTDREGGIDLQQEHAILNTRTQSEEEEHREEGREAP